MGGATCAIMYEARENLFLRRLVSREFFFRKCTTIENVLSFNMYINT